MAARSARRCSTKSAEAAARSQSAEEASRSAEAAAFTSRRRLLISVRSASSVSVGSCCTRETGSWRARRSAAMCRSASRATARNWSKIDEVAVCSTSLRIETRVILSKAAGFSDGGKDGLRVFHYVSFTMLLLCFSLDLR